MSTNKQHSLFPPLPLDPQKKPFSSSPSSGPQTLEGFKGLPLGQASEREEAGRILLEGFLGFRCGFDPPNLERPGRQPHQQGFCEARLGYQNE